MGTHRVECWGAERNWCFVRVRHAGRSGKALLREGLLNKYREMSGLWLDKKQGGKDQKRSVSDSITIDLFFAAFIVHGSGGGVCEVALPTFTPSSLWLLSLLLPVQLPFYFLFFLLFLPWVIWSQNYVIFICIHPALISDTCWFRHYIGVCIEQSKCMCAHTYVCTHVHACIHTHLSSLQVSCVRISAWGHCRFLFMHQLWSTSKQNVCWGKTSNSEHLELETSDIKHFPSQT